MAARRPRGPSEPEGGATPLSALLGSVKLSRAVVARLEARTKQQVRAAVDAQAVQQRSLALGGDLDAPWRSVGGVGCLRAFKMRGRDPAAGALSWPTSERSATDELAIGEERALARSAAPGVFASATGAAGISRNRSRTCARAPTTDQTSASRSKLDTQSFRAFGRVQGHFRDIVGAHYAANSADFVQQQRLLSPYVTDAAVLRTIRASKDSYFGIKWVCEMAPSSLLLSSGSSNSKRDCCFLEMVGFTTDSQGREVGFVAVASIDSPECPPFPEFLRVARVRMQRTLIVRATDATLATSELFIMGESDDARSASSLAVSARLRVLMTVMNDVSLVIDSQNLVKQTLFPQRPWVPDSARSACSICSREFHFLKRRRHHCRLCGDLVCKTCYVLRTVPCADFGTTASAALANADDQAAIPPLAAPTRTRLQRAVTDIQKRREDPSEVETTKFCVRCVMGLRAIDNRLEAFVQEISKLMSISNPSFIIDNEIEASGVSTATSTSNMSTRGRGSSVTYFKRGSNETREFNLDNLFEDHVKQAHDGRNTSKSKRSKNTNVSVETADFTVPISTKPIDKGGRIGTTTSTTKASPQEATDWTAMEKKLRSIEGQPTDASKQPHPLVIARTSSADHSSSRGKLVRLSALSRSSSSSKLLAELYDRGSVVVT